MQKYIKKSICRKPLPKNLSKLAFFFSCILRTSASCNITCSQSPPFTKLGSGGRVIKTIRYTLFTIRYTLFTIHYSLQKLHAPPSIP